MNKKIYDVIIIGGGHAGCEASLAAARMGFHTLLMTIDLSKIAEMSCNPSIGQLGKSHIVRELDALGGEMAKITDKTGIQFRTLNTKKGPAVQALRVQCDKYAYKSEMRKVLEKQKGLNLVQAIAEKLKIKNEKLKIVVTKEGEEYKAKAIILTAGTFLNGLIHIGDRSFSGGRMGEQASLGLSESLKKLGFKINRLKTGTPARLDKKTISFSKTKKQPGDKNPECFSFFTKKINTKQIPCYITYTNAKTHEIIRKNLHLSAMYSGKIKATGVRYCPSIEDKITRFKDKERHQVFLEPEGRNVDEIYPNGISTSLPEKVQEEYIHSIKGLEKAKIIRPGYAIEYDYFSPIQLKPTLETKLVENLYFAGQVNGTTGYEEAAAQGLIAGINACLKLKGKQPFIPLRSEAYIGVMIDDLVTKGVEEPYRMFTSRAEYRLVLRCDNADRRMMPYGNKFGLISDKDYEKFEKKWQQVDELVKAFSSRKLRDANKGKRYSAEARNEARIELKYKGYLERQQRAIDQFKKFEERPIPADLDYSSIYGLKTEAKQKLIKIRPFSLGQAARIQGITPSDITILMVHLKKTHKDL